MKANQAGVGTPAAFIACLASALSMQSAQAATPGPGEGDAEDLEQLLRGAVLAAAAVHGDEGDVGPLGEQPLDQVGAGVERHRLVAESRQRVLDPRARAQRDAALQRLAALEDRDLHSPSAALAEGQDVTLAGSSESALEESDMDAGEFGRERRHVLRCVAAGQATVS